MANQITTQILVDSERNVVLKLDGFLDTSDVSSLTTLLDPATLASVNATGLNSQKATSLAISKVIFDVEDALAVDLYWDATTPVPIWHFTGRGKIDARHFGNLQLKGSGGTANTAPAGATGKILYDTQGWSTGAKLSFTLMIECIKQWT
jgi:hypothetical protein